jgi:hypothetical protein
MVYYPSECESKMKVKEILSLPEYVKKNELIAKQVAGKLRREICYTENMGDAFYEQERYINGRKPWFEDDKVFTNTVEVSKFNMQTKKWIRKGPSILICAKEGNGYRLLAHYLHGTCTTAFNFRGMSILT